MVTKTGLYPTVRSLTPQGRGPQRKAPPIPKPPSSPSSPSRLQGRVTRGRSRLSQGGSGSQIASLPSPVIGQTEPPKLVGTTLRIDDLLKFFPCTGSSICASPSRRGIQVKLTSFSASAKQILDYPFDPEEVKQLKAFAFYQTDIGDEQIDALVKRFPFVEQVTFHITPRLTDRAIYSLGTLRNLKSAEFSHCHNVTDLEGLPLEQLEKLTLSTALGPRTIPRVVKSPVLREVCFGTFYEISPEELLCFQQAHESHPIQIHIRDSRKLNQNHIDALNKERKMPVNVITENELSKPAVIRIEENPPEKAEKAELYVKGDSSKIDFMTIKGIKTACIYDCSDMRDEQILPIRHLADVEILWLGSLSKAQPNSIERMLWQQHKPKPWSKLQELHVYNLLISDGALNTLSAFPNLTTVTLSGCDSFTLQGLQQLVIFSPKLSRLRISRCPSIDPLAIRELQKMRTDVTFECEIPVDQTVVSLAVEEAKKVMADRFFPRRYAFLTELVRKNRPIPEKEEIKSTPEEIEAYAAKMMKWIGLEKKSTDTPMDCDQILQAYRNISRALWAIRKALLGAGFFIPPNPETDPRNAQDILNVLKEPPRKMAIYDENGEISEVKSISAVGSVSRLDFDDLRMTYLPSFLAEFQWSSLKELSHRGDSFIGEIPETFRARYPKLKTSS